MRWLFAFISCLYSWPASGQVFVTHTLTDQGQVAVSGSRVVYCDARAGDYDIYLTDLSTGQETPIFVGPEFQVNPHIDGMRVVWNDTRTGNGDIYLRDLVAGTEQRLVSNNLPDTRPILRGNRMVFSRTLKSGTALVSLDLGSGRETAITAKGTADPKATVSFDGSRAAWGDNRNGDWEVYLWDFITASERRITTIAGHQYRPSVDGDWLVYEDGRDGNCDITLHHLVTGEERRLAAEPGDQTNPLVKGQRVFWWDEVTGRMMMYDITARTTRALFSFSYDSVFFFRHAVEGEAFYCSISTDFATNIVKYDLANSLAGDLDGDGTLTMADVGAALQADAGLASCSQTQVARGDVASGVAGSSWDGRIDLYDALRIIRHLNGLETRWP